MKRVLCTVAVGALALLSCTDDPTGPEAGGIGLEVHVVRVTSASDAAGAGPAAIEGVQPSLANGQADSARIRLSGPESRTVSATPGQTVAIDGLPVGTYTAVLEAFAGDEIGWSSTVSNILVARGEQTTVEAIMLPTRLEFVAVGQAIQLDGPAGATWESEDESIVTVDASGLVTSVGNGVADITGTLGSSVSAAAARVEQVVSNVTVEPDGSAIAAGETLEFTATAFDSEGSEVTDFAPLWVSSNHAVAIIDQAGLVTGMGEGSATITASVQGQPGSATLDVTDRVATQLAFSLQPGPAVAHSSQGAVVQIEIRDASGALVTTARNLVTIALDDNPTGATLAGVTTVAAVGGVATFSGLTLPNGVGYTFEATSGSLTGVTSEPFDVGRVALLANTSYVDYIPGDAVAEASNLEASWESLGSGVNTFTDVCCAALFDAVLARAEILTIPELEFGDLGTDLTAEARTSISDFVDAGGTLVAFYGFSNTSTFLNAVFGFSVTEGFVSGSINLNAGNAAGTPFEGGPAALVNANATNALLTASLPSGSNVIYETGAAAAVAVIPVGSGRIVFLAWDWFNAIPVGAVGTDWTEVLRRAGLF